MRYLSEIVSVQIRCGAWLAGLLVVYGGLAGATTVESRLPSGVIADAEFWAGEPRAPAVLMVHAFLQTRSFPTLYRLAESLSERGNTVLAPTLTLAIGRRAKSLPCEAVHPHSMEDDVREIGHWVRWLVARGYREVVLVGHSSGAIQALAYIAATPHPAVKKVIAIGLAEMRVADAAQRRARTETAAGPGLGRASGLGIYSLSYCDNYVAPPAAFRSYAEWSNARILAALGQARASVEVIIGTSDSHMAANWPEQLRAHGAQVTLGPGAGHFFDDEHEFALVDGLVHSLQQLKKAD